MIGGKGRVVWNDEHKWWDYEEPRVAFTHNHIWTRYLVIIPVDRVPLTLEEIAIKYR